MSDFGAAIGLVLVIEGLLWAAFPGVGRMMLEAAAQRGDQQNRVGGLIAAAIGVGVIWIVRG